MITWFCVKRQKIDDTIGCPQYLGHEVWGESNPGKGANAKKGAGYILKNVSGPFSPASCWQHWLE